MECKFAFHWPSSCFDSPFTNKSCQLQEVASGAPLAMVAVTIDQVGSELGGLCHQQIQLPLGQLVELLKLNRAIKQVALEPLGVDLLGRDIQ
jgi:hypothetical protein